MWTAPEAITHLNNLRTFPAYDMGMLLSYLSIVPVMGLFVFSLETNFYDSYIQYIRTIEQNAPLSIIEQERLDILDELKENGRSFFILQGSISLLIILLAPNIFEWAIVDFFSLNIFRQGVIGAFFSALNLFIIVIFSYFDSQDNMVKVTMTMFFSNALFTFITLKLGFPFYGYGYSLSMILTFLVGAVILIRFLDQLNYHIFITNIIKHRKYTKHHENSDGRIGSHELQ